eukprot:5173045-Prymnesium_polylepis.1
MPNNAPRRSGSYTALPACEQSRLPRSEAAIGMRGRAAVGCVRAGGGRAESAEWLIRRIF